MTSIMPIEKSVLFNRGISAGGLKRIGFRMNLRCSM